MKIFISADIEGVAGICHWDETYKEKPDYKLFQAQMQREVQAACEGALQGGATAIRVRDAHDSGRNLNPWELPEPVELVRAWSQHPFLMVQQLDESFDALLLIGYHSEAGSGHSPLAHTMRSELAEMRVNGLPVSEFHLHAWTAAGLGVPTVFVSGDVGLIHQVKLFDPAIRTVSTNTGHGQSVVARHPARVVRQIREGVTEALSGVLPAARPLEGPYRLEIHYKEAPMAYRASHYPGAKAGGSHSVVLEAELWFEIMRAMVFIA